MPRATLYTLTQEQVNIRPGQHQIMMQERLPFSFTEPTERPQVRVVDIRQWRDEHGGTEFIAVDDQAYRFARMVLIDEFRELERRVADFKAVATDELRKRHAFNALPWYRRVWAALRGGVS